jgi:hypothetical protein
MKKSLSLLLSLAMILCLFPFSALAIPPVSVTVYSADGTTYDPSDLGELGISVSAQTVTLSGVDGGSVGGILIESALDFTLAVEGANSILHTTSSAQFDALMAERAELGQRITSQEFDSLAPAALKIRSGGAVTIQGEGSLTLSSQHGDGLYVGAASLLIKDCSIDTTGYLRGAHLWFGDWAADQLLFRMQGADLRGTATSQQGGDSCGIWTRGTMVSIDNSQVTGLSASDGEQAGALTGHPGQTAGVWFYGAVDIQNNSSVTAKGFYTGLAAENFTIGENSVATAHGDDTGISCCRMTIAEGGNVYATVTGEQEDQPSAVCVWSLTLDGGYLRARNINGGCAVFAFPMAEGDGIYLGEAAGSVVVAQGDYYGYDVFFLAANENASFPDGGLPLVSLGIPTLPPTLPDPRTSDDLGDSDLSAEEVAAAAELNRVLAEINLSGSGSEDEDEAEKDAPVIRLNSSVLNQVSWRIVDAMAGRDVILSIAIGNTTVEINGLKVQKPARNRVFYTIEDFIALYAE